MQCFFPPESRILPLCVTGCGLHNARAGVVAGSADVIMLSLIQFDSVMRNEKKHLRSYVEEAPRCSAAMVYLISFSLFRYCVCSLAFLTAASVCRKKKIKWHNN